jgi:hypothetical protein
MTATMGPSPFEQGIIAGFERAELFGITPGPQGGLFEAMNEAVPAGGLGQNSAALFAEVLTVANAGREVGGEPPLNVADVRLAFSFWEWLFDGLIRR